MKISGADFRDNIDQILDHAMESGETVEIELDGSRVRMNMSDAELCFAPPGTQITDGTNQTLVEEDRNSRDEYPGAIWVEGV